MSNTLPRIIQRAEALLAQYEALQRTNAFLSSELQQVRTERNLIKARAESLQNKLDDLLDRLPPVSSTAPAPTPPAPAAAAHPHANTSKPKPRRPSKTVQPQKTKP